MMKATRAITGTIAALAAVGLLAAPSFAASPTPHIDYVSQIHTGATPLYAVSPPITTPVSATDSITIKVSGLQKGMVVEVVEVQTTSALYVELLPNGHQSYNGPSTEVFNNVPIASGTNAVAVE
jgi:hypothetical protein